MNISVTLLLSILVTIQVSSTRGFLLPQQQTFVTWNTFTCHDDASRILSVSVSESTTNSCCLNNLNNLNNRFRLSSTFLEASKKKRRRRKGDASSSSSSSSSSPESSAVTPPPPTAVTPPPSSDDDDDELPDFDLIEDIDLPSTETSMDSTAPTTAAASTPPPAPKKKNTKTIDVNDPAVIAAMQATKGIESMGTMSSTKDLLRSRDRELEQKLVVDEIVQDVPSFAEYNKRKGNAGGAGAGAGAGGAASGIGIGSDTEMGGMGKKAMKREQRRAAALEAEGKVAVDEEGGGIGQAVGKALSFLPFVENKEDKSAIKLLEEGTWACIYLLVGWEIYINSPLFNRAAPMAPVVFEDPVTMTFLI